MRIELTKPYTRGADVRHVQERLVAHGYRVATDGIYGPASCNAVKAVQALYGLTVDGIVDDKNSRRVGRSSADHSAAVKARQ